MKTTSLQALREFLLRMGDNTLILGHRISEWCGHAPVLEEDIAMANVALDLIGQTQYWLGMAAEKGGDGKTADHLAYLRDAYEFRNLLLVEQPNRDYARTLMRQFLFDSWHLLQLEALTASGDAEVAEVAQKAIKEVSYHLERSSDLMIRLGDGSEESHARMQKALDDLWPYVGELFIDDAVDEELAGAGVAPLPSSLREPWFRQVRAVFDEATLKMPDDEFAHRGGKQGRHTEHLGYILADMQFLQRAYPGSTW
ncbi:MAG: 1,2-phenylacetyl-CoA epoxidase subunit PaaC [Lautropia sp.]|nr:1,2-phenylacetyl-CoA epoxidase subunit PaaC [Lautropia sp.]